MRVLLPRRLTLAVLISAVLAPNALAENPNWPVSTTVDRQSLENPQNQPDDLGGQWNLYGYMPSMFLDNPVISDSEKANGIGMSVDRAWQRSIGDPRTIIAIIDSGFLWNNRDLVNKWFLNRGELPPPNRTDCVGTDKYDCNGDGVFNIQDYTTATGHQQPDVSTIADKTLLARADHGDVNGNGFLDPQDLIAAFSDGQDNDGNGFVDDICGWDFMWDDNDPEDDILNGGQGYSHGTGEAEDSGAETNNGMGGAGVCPRCTILPLRGGDSFIGEANNQALAMYYANAMGASVVQVAQIVLGNATFERDAVNDIYTRANAAAGTAGTLVVASSADETSAHNMWPAIFEHTLEVDGMRFDGSDWNDPNNTTFTNFANDTNWGGHLSLTAPCTSASSEATGKISGVMGLIFSYARQLGMNPPLTPAEAYQIAIHSVYDVNVANSGLPDEPDGGISKYPSGPGWDSHFSYGRPDARAALDALQAGRIPPEVDILPGTGSDSSPGWFQVYDPATTVLNYFGTHSGEIAIDARIAAPRAASYDYVVEAAPGLQPRDPEFLPIIADSGSKEVNGTVATLDIGLLMGNLIYPPSEPLDLVIDPHLFAATIRIRATAHYNDARGDVKGEFKKVIFIRNDPDVMPGFPLKMNSSGEASPKLFDLDGDGKDEIIVATDDGAVHAFRGDADGGELPGFPARTSPYQRAQKYASLINNPGAVADAFETIVATPAIGDVDGDGKPDIVVSTVGGSVHAFNNQGQELPNFPVRLSSDTLPLEVPDEVGRMKATGQWTVQASVGFPDGGSQGRIDQQNELESGFFASPVLYDMDGDGKLDIVQAGMDGYVHVWNYTGHELPGFPVQVRDINGGTTNGYTITERTRIISTPAVGDVDGDGKPEILVGSNEVLNGEARAYLIKNTGATSPAQFSSAYMPGWPVSMSGLEVFILPYIGKGNPNNPIIADLDGDGVPELLTHPVGTDAYVWDKNGQLLFATQHDHDTTTPNSARTSNEQASYIVVNSGTVADLDGDGLPEYIDGTIPALDYALIPGGIRSPFDHQLSAWNIGQTAKLNRGKDAADRSNAKMLPAFPQKVPDFQFLTNYAVADIDGDGLPEVISGSGMFLVTAFNKDGTVPAGWPKFNGGWTLATPAIGDLLGDGKLEVVTITREGWLWAWKTGGTTAGKVLWDSFHHDARNTGNTATPLEVRKAPPINKPNTSTNCGSCSSVDGGLFGLLSWIGLALRRRSRTRK
jgi:hypothetical protein